jgi:hypothetical protein
MLAPLMETRPAGAPLPKALAATSPGSGVTPLGAPRSISRRELFQVIQAELDRKGISTQGELRPEDLNIQSSVPALMDDVGLQVKKVRFDPLRHEVVFEMWASQEPQFLPFEVTTRQNEGLISELAGGLADAGAGVQTESPTLGQGVSHGHSNPPVLAKPGTLATLIMLGQNVRITTTVLPLQPGAKGQSILVRESTTARVMTAEVVDLNLLQVRF